MILSPVGQKYEDNKIMITNGTQQQVKCVYVPQEKVWKVSVQYGKVNAKGSFFVIEHKIEKNYLSYEAANEWINYLLAKPVAYTDKSAENNKIDNNDCMSEVDIELAEQFTRNESEGAPRNQY